MKNDEWMKIEFEFREKWNFLHCLAAIDGKHKVIQTPPRSGSDYFNYKKNSVRFWLYLIQNMSSLWLYLIQNMSSLSLTLFRLGNKVMVMCIKTATWVMPLIKIYLMYLLHQMICSLIENIIHTFLWKIKYLKCLQIHKLIFWFTFFKIVNSSLSASISFSLLFFTFTLLFAATETLLFSELQGHSENVDDNDDDESGSTSVVLLLCYYVLLSL